MAQPLLRPVPRSSLSSNPPSSTHPRAASHIDHSPTVRSTLSPLYSYYPFSPTRVKRLFPTTPKTPALPPEIECHQRSDNFTWSSLQSRVPPPLSNPILLNLAPITSRTSKPDFFWPISHRLALHGSSLFFSGSTHQPEPSLASCISNSVPVDSYSFTIIRIHPIL